MRWRTLLRRHAEQEALEYLRFKKRLADMFEPANNGRPAGTLDVDKLVVYHTFLKWSEEDLCVPYLPHARGGPI